MENGVDIVAPQYRKGKPEDFGEFIDACAILWKDTFFISIKRRLRHADFLRCLRLAPSFFQTLFTDRSV